MTYEAQWVLIPAAPGASSTHVTKDLITFKCTSDDEHEPYVLNWFGSHVTYNKDMAWDAERNVFTCSATVNLGTIVPFVIDKKWGNTKHHYDKRNVVIHLVWDETATGLNSQGKETTGLWKPDGEQLIELSCYTAPAAPSDSYIQKLSKVLYMIDSTNSKNWMKPTLIDGTYTVSEMAGNKTDGFYCTVTITDFAPYVEAFNAKYTGARYIMDEESTTAEFTYTLKYTGSTTEYKQDGTGWTIDTTNMTKAESLNGKKLMVKPVVYTVTYTDGLEGSAFAEQSSVVLEDAQTPAFEGTPERTGYTFLGWSPEVAATVTADTVYTAMWSANSYTLYFNTVGGSKCKDQSVTYDAAIGSLPTPYRMGYKFMGWYDEAGNLVEADSLYQVAEDMTLKARWSYKIPLPCLPEIDPDQPISEIEEDLNSFISDIWDLISGWFH